MPYFQTKTSLPTIKDLFFSIFIRTPQTNFFCDYWKIDKHKKFLFSRSSHALRFIAKLKLDCSKKERINIWIPSYFCDESLIPLRRENVSIIFYPILSDGSPSMDAILSLITEENKPDLVMATHYFGQIIDISEFVEFADSQGAWVIEDGAHILKAENKLGSKSHFIFFSPHKLLPIPDGSILLMNNQRMSEDFNYEYDRCRTMYDEYIDGSRKNTSDIVIWILKRFLQSIGIRKRPQVSLDIFGDDFLKTNATFKEPRISTLSLKLISLLSQFEHECLSRKENYIFWRDLFLDNGLNGEELFSLGDIECPYVFAIRFKDKSKLIDAIEFVNEKNIPVSSWPDLPAEVLVNNDFFKNSIDMKRQTLFLPVHSSLILEQI